MKNLIKLSRFSVLISYFLLIAFMLLWHFQLDSNTTMPDSVYVGLFILPLMFPLKGIIQGNPYTYAWSNFIILLYLCHGLTVLWVHPDEKWLAMIELFLASVCFIGSTYYAKHQGRELGIGLKKAKERENT